MPSRPSLLPAQAPHVVGLDSSPQMLAASEKFVRPANLEFVLGDVNDYDTPADLVFSTDYPHGDSAYPHAVDGFEQLDLPFDAKVRIVGENWSRLYRIPLERKAPRT